MIKISCQKKVNPNFTLDMNLEIPMGKFVCLYGKSGSGKTTLLRLIAGFLKADSGEISVGEKVFFDDKKFLSPQKRGVGYIFQDYALFDNMSVFKNLLFAKKDLNLAKKLLNLMELEGYENTSPTHLSGGQKQRVALARALMLRPKILLLDEPLSALDAKMRTKLQDYLARIHSEFQTTMILVSHDVSEIYKLSQIVYEIDNGRVVRSGLPSDIFLKTSGSQKFSFHAQIVDLAKKDAIFIATLAIGNQISQVVLTPLEANGLKIGDFATISAKAYAINLKKIAE